MGDYILDELSHLTGSIPDRVWHIHKHGDYIIMSGGYIDCKLSIIDVSDPDNPAVLDEYDQAPNGQVSGIVANDDYFYVTSGESDDLLVFDWTDPENITLRGNVDVGSSYVYMPGYTADHPDHVFCGLYSATGYIVSFDVSDPDNPTKVDDLTHADLANATHVVCYGDYAYVTTTEKLVVVDISDPTAMTFVGSCAITNSSPSAGPSGISINSDATLALVWWSWKDQFDIVDISVKASPSKLSSTTDATYLDGIHGAYFTGENDARVIASTYTYPNPGTTLLTAWDAADKNNPLSLIESVEATKRASAFCLDDDYLYYGWDSGSYNKEYFAIHGLGAGPDGIYVTVGGVEFQDKCLSVRTERGRDEELGQAQTGIAELTCDNQDGDFSPENAGGAYYGTLVLGAELKVYEIYNGVQYDHFTGKIDKILPHAEWDNRVAYIAALDGMDDLAGTEIKTVLRTDTETGELCDDVLDAIGWIDDGDHRDIDTGIDVLQYGWFHKVKGLDAIRTLERIEKGFFYVDVDGKAIWENRHHRLTGDGLVSQADFEDTMVEVGYEYSKRQVRNQVTIKGRRYFSGGVTLWSGYDLATLDDDLVWSAHCGDAQAPYIPQASTLTLWAEWNSPLASSTALVEGTHWNANTVADKSGTDVGANITITETAYGQAIKLEIENAGSVGAYLVVPDSPPTGAPSDRTLLIYGILFGEENVTITVEDATSQTAYGIRSLEIDAPFKSNPNDIRALAEYLLARFKDPVPDAVSVRLVARTNATIRVECLQRKISDRITLKVTLHGFDRDFFINKVIQDYILKEGGFVHETTWSVERAEGAYEHLFWLLGVAGFGELGEATYLGV